MSIRKNTWDLSGHYDLTKSGQNAYIGNNLISNFDGNLVTTGGTWNEVTNIYSTNNITATKTDRTLWAWGSNNYGQLGQNNRISYSSPIQIPGTQWNKCHNSFSSFSNYTKNSTLATKTDGTLWSWGYNALGTLGQNNLTYYSSPVQIPGTQWQNIAGHSYAAFATKTDGTLWAWGNQITGVLGLNASSGSVLSPRQVPGTQWNNIRGGQSHTISTKTDGTLWSWGNNQFGQLGQNNITRSSSPVQIPGTQWKNIACSRIGSVATKTDGTLWVWGDNRSGQLGLGDFDNRSSPTQIPGTSWNLVASNPTELTGSPFATKTDGTLWNITNNTQTATGFKLLSNDIGIITQ